MMVSCCFSLHFEDSFNLGDPSPFHINMGNDGVFSK